MDLLYKLNGLFFFLAKIAQVMISRIGIIILGIVVLIIFSNFIITIIDKRERSLPVAIRDSISALFRPFYLFFTNIPILLIVLAIAFGAIALSKNIDTILEIQKGIERNAELRTTLKHLCIEEKIAEININDIKYIAPDLPPNIDFSIKRYYSSPSEEVEIEQEVPEEYIIQGNVLYLGTATLDFKYTEIIDTVRNIAIPQIIYTDTVAIESAIKFPFLEDGIVFSFIRSEKDLYGISVDTYEERIKEISKMFMDPEYAKIQGVVSATGRAIGISVNQLQKGSRIIFKTTQTGGLAPPQVSGPKIFSDFIK